MNKKVIQLLRVSTSAQSGEDRASLPAQKAICAKIAQQYGLTIVRTVELVDVSGAAVLKTPEMQELLATLERGEIHGVVAREFSRLMRPENFADFIILQTFADSHTLLYLPDGPLDFASKAGRLMGTIRAAIAGLERSEIAERVASAKEQMRREGRWPNSERVLPFGVGYDRKTQTWHYTPAAERVREVFRRFLAGDTNYDGLARILGTSRGTARNILQNPIYTGWFVYDEKRDPSPAAKRLRADGRHGDRRKMPRAPEDVIRVRVIEEGLVSQADFDRVQYLIQQKAQYNIRLRQKVGLFVYAGHLWCSKCGDRLHTFRNQFDRFYYLCANKKRKDEAGNSLCPYTAYMNRDRLEAVLDRLFCQQLTDPAFLLSVYEHQRRRARESDSAGRRLRLQQEVERLQAKRSRVMELFIEGEISRGERLLRLEHLDRSLRQTEELLAAETPSMVEGMDVNAVADLFSPFLEWPYLNREDKRQLLAGLAPEIKVADYEVSGVVVPLTSTHIASCSEVNRPRTEPFPSPAPPCPSPSRRASCWQPP